VTEVAADPAALLGIPARNVVTLRGLGRAEVIRRWRETRG
jgi:hypothetical protein